MITLNYLELPNVEVGQYLNISGKIRVDFFGMNDRYRYCHDIAMDIIVKVISFEIKRTGDVEIICEHNNDKYFGRFLPPAINSFSGRRMNDKYSIVEFLDIETKRILESKEREMYRSEIRSLKESGIPFYARITGEDVKVYAKDVNSPSGVSLHLACELRYIEDLIGSQYVSGSERW